MDAMCKNHTNAELIASCLRSLQYISDVQYLAEKLVLEQEMVRAVSLCPCLRPCVGVPSRLLDVAGCSVETRRRAPSAFPRSPLSYCHLAGKEGAACHALL